MMPITIETTGDLLRLLDENEEFLTAVRSKILTQELLDLPRRFAEYAAETDRKIDALIEHAAETDRKIAALTVTVERLVNHAEETNRRLDKLEETVAALVLNAEATNKRLDGRDARLDKLTAETRVNTRHIGEMRGLFAAQKVIREAPLITDRIGLRSGRALETQEIIDIWNLGADKGLTQGIAKSDEESFKTADLVIEARTSEGERRYIAVEISYTANGREVRRAARNAGYISSFSEVPTYAVAAGMFKDDRIEERLTTDEPQPYAGNAESPIYWSQHTDIDRPE